MQIQKISFTPNQFTQKQIQFKANQENAFAPQQKNNTKRNVIIATAVATPIVIFGLYKALKRGKANEIIDTAVGIKELPEFKNPDAERIINETREKLTKKPIFSPEALDKRITNGATKPDAWSFDDMEKYYAELEEKAQAKIKQAEEEARRAIEETKRKGQELVASLDKLGKGTSVVDEKTINNVLETQGARKSNAWDPADMKRYYEGGCITEEYEHGVKVITYPKSLEGKQTIKKIYSNGEIETTTFNNLVEEITKDNKGNIIKKANIEKTLSGKKGIIEEFDPATGKVIKRKIFNGRNVEITNYHGDIRTTSVTDKDGKVVEKIFQKDKDGKYKCIRRNISYPDYPEAPIKTVEHLDNGYTKITESELKQTTITIKDKKGNIVDIKNILKGTDGGSGDLPPADAGKMLAAWYKDYLELCGKYGEPIRICGVKGGAWDHYYELCLRRDDPEAYATYLRNLAYRARYNEDARIALAIREGILKPGEIEQMTPDEKELLEIFQQLLKKLPEYEQKNFTEELNNQGLKNLEELLYRIKSRIEELEYSSQPIMVYA